MRVPNQKYQARKGKSLTRSDHTWVMLEVGNLGKKAGVRQSITVLTNFSDGGAWLSPYPWTAVRKWASKARPYGFIITIRPERVCKHRWPSVTCDAQWAICALRLTTCSHWVPDLTDFVTWSHVDTSNPLARGITDHNVCMQHAASTLHVRDLPHSSSHAMVPNYQ